MATPPARLKAYKQLLTPALHRRFNRAAAITLGLCYAESIFIGKQSSLLWIWFPLGPAGIRALLLFISALLVFVLRVAQIHLGTRSTVSSFQTFRQKALSLDTVQTLGWYIFSAWWFSEIYLWAAPLDANLGWISSGKSWERKRLNERPIYLRSVFMMLAIMQTAYHLGFDYDRISLPIDNAEIGTGSEEEKSAEKKLPPRIQPRDKLRSTSIPTLRTAGLQSAAIAILAPVIYALFIRNRAWEISMFFTRLLWDVAPVAELSYVPPYHISLIWRSMTSGFLLLYLWQSSNDAFSALFALEPVKMGQPLSADSTDPNGSLLDGLKSKKEINKSFAFWELLYISRYFDERRKTIFTEISRANGSTWSQIEIECLLTIQSVSSRINDYRNPPPTTTTPQTQAPIQSLPRLTPGLRQDSVFNAPTAPNTPLKKVEYNISNIAKSYGQSPPTKTSPLSRLSPHAKRLTDTAGQKLLTQGQQENLSLESLRATFGTYLMSFIRSPFGYPFRQPFARRINAVAFGTPQGHSDVFIIVNAIDALSVLSVASLKEDPYGKVAYDVDLIMKTFIMVLVTLQGFVKETGTHWTDVEGSREVEDVDLVLGRLKEGLGTMVKAFEGYADDFGIEKGTVRQAKQLSGAES